MKFFAVLILFVFLIPACRSSSLSDNPPIDPSAQPQIDLPVSDFQLPKLLEVSTLTGDVVLAQKIADIIDRGEFANARWGTIVISMKDGRVVTARDAQRLFTPASTLKLVTVAAALDKLGADFRWKTSLYSQTKITDGKLAGDLILYGRGAPDLSSERLAELADMLKKTGLRRVEGDIVGDGSYFRGDGLGDGWLWGDAQWYYGAQAAALTFNDNQVDLEVSTQNARVETNQLSVESDIKPLAPGKPEAVGINRQPGSDSVYVWGDKQPGSNLKARLAVPNSAQWAAQELKKELEKRGIAVAGKVRTADWRSKDKLDESTTVELASIESKTLAEVAHKTNKDSVNLYAELMLRTLGKKFGVDALDEDVKVQALRGDDHAGATVIKKWLRDNNIESGDTAMHDGSGLSRLNLVSPETLARLLVFALRSKDAEVFKNSLPVSGVDGTMRGRLSGFSGKVLAKTGSITYVNTLAGYAKTGEETLAFVIFCNNETRKSEVAPVIDQIAAAIAGHSAK